MVVLNVLFPLLLALLANWWGKVRINAARRWSVESEIEASAITSFKSKRPYMFHGGQILSQLRKGRVRDAIQMYVITIVRRMGAFYSAPITKVGSGS